MAVIPKERLERTRELWLMAKSPRSIERVICAEFGVTARAARNYIRRVRDHLNVEPGTDAEPARKRSEEMLLEVYDRASSRVNDLGEPDPDLKTMATCARHLAELHGALVQRVEHSGGVGLNAKADDELLARLARVAASAVGGGRDDAAGAATSAVPVAAVGATEAAAAKG